MLFPVTEPVQHEETANSGNHGNGDSYVSHSHSGGGLGGGAGIWQSPSRSIYVIVGITKLIQPANLFNRLDLYCAILLQIGPCSALVIMNTALVYIALKRSNTSVNWANVSVVVFVTAVFIASILPHFVYFIENRQNWTDSVELRWTVATTLVSTFSNPVIYFLTNPTFRSFTIGWITRTSSKFKSPDVRVIQVQSKNMRSGESTGNMRASTKESIIVHQSAL